MKKLSNLLPYKYWLLIIFVFLYTFIITNNLVYKTEYQEGANIIEGKIVKISKQNEKVSIVLKAREKIKVTYYTKNIVDYQLGDVIKVEGALQKSSGNTIFNLYNYKLYLMSNKIYFVLMANSIEKIKDNKNVIYKLKNYIYEKVKYLKSSNYLKAFILGDTIDINDDMKNVYQENGISHLLAISGMHIDMLSNILEKILKKIKKSHLIISIFMCIYAFLANFTPSVIRATCFFVFKKYTSKRKLIILIISILLLFNPYYIYNLGFLFSFIISFYLIIFSYKTRKIKNYFIKILIISTISFLASMPILINNFYYINLLSPIINIFFVPFISLIIFPMSLLTLIFPFLDKCLYFCINCLEYMSILINRFNINITMAKIPIYLSILYYFIITLIIIKAKTIPILILLILIHSNIKVLSQNNYLTMLDVGQGDSFLLELKNKTILIDTGGIIDYGNTNKYSIVISKTIPYLKSRGIKSIDYLILTHGDNDHIGEAINLINNFKIKNVILNSGEINKLEEQVIENLKEKNITYYMINNYLLKINNSEFYFINNKDEKNENEDSLIIYTKINNRNILFMGDAGIESENYILNEYNLPKMDILKVGHHGSKTSSSNNFIKSITPTISLISVGLNNRYNHPNTEVIENLNKIQTSIYETSIDGSVQINLKNLKIYTCSNVYANGC